MLVDMPNPLSEIAKINQRNHEFWALESKLLSRRIQDPALHEIAMDTLSREEAKAVHIRHRYSLEEAFSRAENCRAIVLHAMARKGGKAGKTDALQCWIIEAVRVDERISSGQLLIKIRKLAKKGDSIFRKVSRKSDTSNEQTEHIYFDDNGESKTASVTGLKDRLFRAKKKILSR